jgi:hypothetical protein
MLTKSRLILTTALAVVALAAPPAFAGPVDPGTSGGTTDSRQLDMHASTVKPDRTTSDARGEHAASLSDATAGSGAGSDLRTEAAAEPFAGPVVVEVGDPVSAGFDWRAAIIGLAGGLAIAVLAGVGVAGGRRRQPRTV